MCLAGSFGAVLFDTACDDTASLILPCPTSKRLHVCSQKQTVSWPRCSTDNFRKSLERPEANLMSKWQQRQSNMNDSEGEIFSPYNSRINIHNLAFPYFRPLLGKSWLNWACLVGSFIIQTIQAVHLSKMFLSLEWFGYFWRLRAPRETVH